MTRPARPLALLPLALLASACATGGVSRGELRTAAEVQYGVVDEVEELQVQSGAGGAAVAGGIIGAIVSDKHRLLGAAAGAVGGAVLATAAEGDRRAYGYTVRLDSGRMIKVVAPNGGVAVGQCVAFEQGRAADVRAVSPEHCRQIPPPPPPPQGAHAAPPPPPPAAEPPPPEVDACRQAKEALLGATTADDVALWERKVKVICGN